MRKVVIVGGGSSGWMAASYMNGALNQQGNDQKVEITLVESPDIPRISVGEATIPSIRHLLAVIGVDEREFMIAADATFKQSIKYVNWVHKNNTFYHHPFSRYQNQPIDNSGINWLMSDRSIPFMETVSAQPIICEMERSPLMMEKWDMGAPLTYAYHMDAQKFANYLRDFSKARGVKHIEANVTDVKVGENEYINSISTDQGHHIEADLYIDCTGFKAKLIGETLDVGFEDCSNFLFCDQAVTMHVPYDKHYPGLIRPYTTASALSNGWVWDIPMKSRRSIGYVHSSKYISDEDAEKEFRAYQGKDTEDLESRLVKFYVGKRHTHWKGNCIALGLSAGFVEPLESTGLYLSDLGTVALCQHFPFDDSHMEAMSHRYNRILSNRFYEILDFINMHYCLTRRTDTEFWRDVQKPEHITDRLKAKFEFWKMRPPKAMDFEDQSFPGQSTQHMNPAITGPDNRAPVDTAGLWNHESYECIMYGMNFMDKEYDEMYGTNRNPPRVFPHIIERLQTANKKLPPHALWLKTMVGMEDYPTAAKPDGWVC
ncbi:MAG: tryptophan 7-halogenase [Gammaproteobacteria bacterium]|nr:tryptophan 7-halogenase [Gammaproteobacteria bacterium]